MSETNHLFKQIFAASRVAKGLLLLASGLLGGACFEGKIVTTKVQKNDQLNGIVYALPKTVVKVDIPIDKVTKTPGKFAAYTPCFFPDDKFVMTKAIEFAVDQEKVRFDDSLFVPDTDEIYLIKTTGGKFETKNLDLELTQSGVFVKATAENTNETIDVVTGLVQGTTSLVGKAILAAAAPGVEKADEVKKQEKERDECFCKSDSFWEMAIDNGRATAKPKALRAGNRNLFDRDYEQAKEIAEKIGDLLARRIEILNTKAQATVPSETLKLIIEQLESSIKTLKTTAFLGTTDRITWNASFRLNPRLPNPNARPNPDPGKMTIDLLTLSEEYGVCSVDVHQGVQFDPRFRIDREDCPEDVPLCRKETLRRIECKGDKIRLKLERGEDGEGGWSGLSMAEKVMGATMTEEGERGFYYRIPGRAIALLYQGEDQVQGELGRAPVSIAQFGQIVSLPSSAGGRRTKYTLALYEASGGLKNFVMGSSALVEKSNVENLTGAASTVIETRAERKKAKQPKDELEELERQRKILEEKKKIRDLQNDLDTAPKPTENP
jgi:hypothetical protein